MTSRNIFFGAFVWDKNVVSDWRHECQATKSKHFFFPNAHDEESHKLTL